MTEQAATKDDSYFSDICIERCGGRCCAPWWGIVSYPVTKSGGLGGLSTFTREMEKGIGAREERIRSQYVTNEKPRRRLFNAPERYNVAIEEMKVEGGVIRLTIRAMFAFRCLFLSDENVCLIHPAVIKSGEDIRPPHCGYMGAPGASYGEKGFCRIIGAAGGTDATARADDEVGKAIELEAASSKRFYDAGVTTAAEAAALVIKDMTERCRASNPELFPGESKKIGRNEPCHCGSGKKYKKCHGR